MTSTYQNRQYYARIDLREGYWKRHFERLGQSTSDLGHLRDIDLLSSYITAAVSRTFTHIQGVLTLLRNLPKSLPYEEPAGKGGHA